MQAPESLSEAQIQKIVEEAGYRFVGVLQEYTNPITRTHHEAQALWIGPETGSTYSLPVSRLSVNEVRAHTYNQDSKFSAGGGQ
jgi:hypothetical protein